LTVVGIDFGTSTTVTALFARGEPKLIADHEGTEVVPSVVAFMPTGKVHFGRGAKARRLIDPHNSIYSFKRIIGRQAHSSEVRAFRERYPFEFIEGDDQIPRFVTRAGELTAVDVAAQLFGHVMSFEALAADMPAKTCVSVPPTFGEPQREAVREAARRAGFGKVSTIDEPVSAALAYLHDQTQPQTVLVYDLGGGTFDIAILKWAKGVAEILAIGGDPFLGGDDVDVECANWVVEQVLQDHRWDIRSSASSYQVLLFAVEQAKIRLSQVEETMVNLARVDEVLAGKTIKLVRSQLETLCAALVRRTFILCDQALADAGLLASNIDTVLLAGGSCYMPAVQQGLGRYFGKTPLLSLPPDRIVSMGAAIRAGHMG